MSAVSESIAQRVTLGMLVERYGFEVDPPFATNVTITSLSDAVDTVIPGSLFICTHEQEPDVLHAAQAVPMRRCCHARPKGRSPMPIYRCSTAISTIAYSAIWPSGSGRRTVQCHGGVRGDRCG